MRKVYLHGQPLALDPRFFLGQGGEAEVYQAGAGLALKIFKDAGHPDFAGRQIDQAAARLRLGLLEERLGAFPRNLPPRVIAPREPLQDAPRRGKVVGFSMELVHPAEPLGRFAERAFRGQGVPNRVVLAVFRDLAHTLLALHRAGVVVGDLNDQNVLVRGEEPLLIDADSFQFGRFPCTVFSPRFLDPLLFDPASSGPVRALPYNQNSDWYAFAVLLLHSLLFVGPYGGVYRPRDRKRAIPQEARPAARITVFHPEVQYPRPASPLAALPAPLLSYFREVFERDRREPFPLALLASARFALCPVCALEHAARHCPVCASAVQLALPVIQGIRSARTVFGTRGIILEAAFQEGQLCVLTHEDGAYRREDGQVLIRDALQPRLEFRLQGNQTLVGLGGEVLCFQHGEVRGRLSVERCGNRHAFAANAGHAYFVDAGQLMRSGALGPQKVGDVLSGQTRIWAGPGFGLGFYRAAGLWVAFVFDSERRGINDAVALPRMSGRLLDASCVFGENRCGLLVSVQEGGVSWNHLVLIRQDGAVEAHVLERAGETALLAHPRGLCEWGGSLWGATDRGLVRLAVSGQDLTVDQELTETEPLVHAGCGLIAGSQGILVVDRQEIRLLAL